MRIVPRALAWQAPAREAFSALRSLNLRMHARSNSRVTVRLLRNSLHDLRIEVLQSGHLATIGRDPKWRTAHVTAHRMIMTHCNWDAMKKRVVIRDALLTPHAARAIVAQEFADSAAGACLPLSPFF